VPYSQRYLVLGLVGLALRRSRSLKVTDFGTNRKLIYDFLVVINTNLPHIYTVSKLWLIIGQIFASESGVSHLTLSLGVTPVNIAINDISLKTRLCGLHFRCIKYWCIFNHFYVKQCRKFQSPEYGARTLQTYRQADDRRQTDGRRQLVYKHNALCKKPLTEKTWSTTKVGTLPASQECLPSCNSSRLHCCGLQASHLPTGTTVFAKAVHC